MTQAPRTSLWPIQIVLILVLIGLTVVGTCTVLVPELEDSGDEETRGTSPGAPASTDE
jgi:hypothetical protein